MIENKKIKNLSCNYTSSLKKKKAELRAWEMLGRRFIKNSISLYPNFQRIVLYLFMHRRHPFASRNNLPPRIAEQMPLRQQQGTWTSDNLPPGLYYVSGTNRWAAGGSQPAPPTAALLPKGGRVTAQRTQKVFRWPSSVDHEQIEFRLAQVITNSRFEFGLPFRDLNWNLLRWGFKQRTGPTSSQRALASP